jgi:hypothetical protein
LRSLWPSWSGRITRADQRIGMSRPSPSPFGDRLPRSCGRSWQRCRRR